jgi:ribosomal protein S6
MRSYELMFIVHPEMDESAFSELVDKVKGWITDSGGQIEKVDLWGKRKLAYPIQKQTEGKRRLTLQFVLSWNIIWVCRKQLCASCSP